jgi:hypothetical protein
LEFLRRSILGAKQEVLDSFGNGLFNLEDVGLIITGIFFLNAFAKNCQAP